MAAHEAHSAGESQTDKHSIVNEIWGELPSESDSTNRYEDLDKYLDHCASEKWVTSKRLIKLLKDNVQTKKQEIRCGNPPDDVPDKEMLGISLRLTYLTACVSSGSGTMSTGQGIFRPTWKSTESLEEYITRVYPKSKKPPQESKSLTIGKLAAAYLESYAKIDFKWTDHLSDHLTFLKGNDWKSLYIFRHPAFLKTSLDALERNDPNLEQGTDMALSL